MRLGRTMIMKFNRIGLAILFAIALFAALVGCGGGTAAGGGGSRSVNVFVADTFADDYDAVWTTLYRVELLNEAGDVTLVWSDTAGRQYDLRRLGDSTGSRFSFLSKVNVANNVYNRIRVTVGQNLNVVATGTTTVTTLPLNGDAAAADGKVTVTRNLSRLINFIDNDDFVIDFDLSRFVVAGGRVTPEIEDGDETGLGDLNRHEADDIKGVVSALAGTAPNLTFDIQIGTNRFLSVRTDSGTTIVNDSGAPSPNLANGRTVEVYGKFDRTISAFRATRVKIEDETVNEQEVEGAASDLNSEAGTFKLSTREVSGFIPSATTVNIVTTTTTRFLSDRGLTITKLDFFEGLAAAEAEGTYNAATNTLTATKVKREDEGDGNNGEVEAEGRYGTKNTTAWTLTLGTVNEFEGWPFPGGILSITTNDSTHYQDAEGRRIERTQFFSFLTTGVDVKVNGVLTDGNTITARRLRIDD